MRVGFNCRFMHASRVTGVERYARNLLSSFLEAGGDVEFVLFGCAGWQSPAALPDNIRKVGTCAWRSAAARQLWEQFILPGLAGKAHVDILINPTNTAPLRFARNVMVIHDLAFLEHPEWFSRGFLRLYRAVVPRAARRALAVMTVSEFSKSGIVKLLAVPPERVHVIYQGVDPVFRPVGRNEIEGVRRKFGLARPYVLFVGSIAPRKNLAAAAAAFGLARKRLLAVHELIVVGARGFQFSNVDVPPGIRNVRAIGYVADEDLRALYAGADALLYPSLYEGFGLPPLEAMACGTPVVTSDCASLPEVVGDAALKVDPKDTEAIADAICRVITDRGLASDLRRKGLERAKLFTWEETARRTLQVCRHVLASSPYASG